MRFMVMHKVTEEMERGLPPDPSVIEGVGKLIGEAAQGGVFVSGEGLKPTSQRTHLTYKKGKRTLQDGPFTEAKELVGGFALMKVRSKDEALAWCDRFAEAMGGDADLFLGPVVEEWDLGVAPKPADAPLRFLALHQVNAASNNEMALSPECAVRMGKLIDEMTKAGVLQATGGLTSTKQGARIRFKGGKHTVTDGPFTESKELVAGYAILELPSKAEAIDWAARFGKVVKVNEIEVRQMA